jgi:CDP-6-deoxy-D-xylo-4-hexulose-3-dehydrase
MINLVEDTIDKQDVDKLIEWLKTYPHLTKGKLTVEFESKWSEWLGVKYSTYVNSGSSANLLMYYALKLSKRMKNNKVVVPAVSWATSVSPAIQFGMEIIICDVELDTLGLNIKHLEEIFIKYNPSALLLVQSLGFIGKMEEIQTLCKKYNVIMLEDSCETVGSTYKGIKSGNFGTMSSFSYYFGHHMSTIEGGMVCTNDKELDDIIKMIRSHGWDRDLSKETQTELRTGWKIEDFQSLYTFYVPGFNVRATDLQAFIGLEQLKKLNGFIKKRNENFITYHSHIKNNFWKINPDTKEIISNFAYPIIHPKAKELSKILFEKEIQNRPLICGSMSKQPFVRNVYHPIEKTPFADEYVHERGIYLPNHPMLEREKILEICDIVNEVLD